MTQIETLGERPGLGARLIDKVSRRMVGVPGREGGYRRVKGTAVRTRDGFELLTDHYVPETESPGGTILVRSPYGRGMPLSLVYGRTFAAAGYHVLVQSVRGTFGSTDMQQPFRRDADDAQDTLSWLREQDWFDGRLATLGGSYLGFAQWALRADPPEELRASVIVVGPHDMSQALYGTGAFTLADFLGWSEGAATVEQFSHLRGMARMVTADKRLQPGLQGLPLADAAEPLLHSGAPWYREWLDHPDRRDPYWDDQRHPAALQSTVPTLLVGGWQDLFLDQTIEQYLTLRARDVDVALTVGPWTHMDTAGKAAGLINRESVDWLDEHLAGDGKRRRSSPVRVFVTGADEWRDYPQWPPAPGEQLFHLDDAAGLSASPGSGASTFIYDPSDPTPAVGGRMISRRHGGVKDNKALEARADVLTFTSQPLAGGLEILGAPVVELGLRVDNPHADVFLRLCDVDQRGRSRNFADALLRLDPDVPADTLQQLTVPLDHCAHQLAAGHRLRLQVSGGAHPRYARNLGTSEPISTGRTLRPSTHVVEHASSRVTLPVSAP
jgi:putative CocE/NonD family hydrolase